MKPNSIEIWHCRGGVSDLTWLNEQFALIPKELRESVGLKYQKVFNEDGRKAANERLTAYIASLIDAKAKGGA